jgi:hypothetical protein
MFLFFWHPLDWALEAAEGLQLLQSANIVHCDWLFSTHLAFQSLQTYNKGVTWLIIQKLNSNHP